MMRVEYRVVAERDGQQWVIEPPYDEKTTDLGAAEALAARWSKPEVMRFHGFDRVFVVCREVLEAPWIGPDGQIWDEQAARDGLLAVANERRYG